MKPVGVVLALAAGLVGMSANAQQADMREAMFAGLKSEQGTYKGELKGDFAALVHQTLKTKAPVFVSVSTVRAFKQQGCKRMRADISVPEFTWRDAKTGAQNSFQYRYEMNVCPDGSPPMEVALETGPVKGAMPRNPELK